MHFSFLQFVDKFRVVIIAYFPFRNTGFDYLLLRKYDGLRWLETRLMVLTGNQVSTLPLVNNSKGTFRVPTKICDGASFTKIINVYSC